MALAATLAGASASSEAPGRPAIAVTETNVDATTGAISVHEKVADASAQQAVQANAGCTVPAGEFQSHTNLYLVPAGKRLVIDYASGTALAPTGTVPTAWLEAGINGFGIGHYILLVREGALNLSFDVFEIAQVTRIYAESPTTDAFLVLFCSASTPPNPNTPAGATSVNVAITGHLVDMP